MNTRITSRITGVGLLILAAVVVTVIKTSGWNAEKLVPAASGLVVHEWGTFTSIAGKDGVALEWRPLNGATDLPRFVYPTEGAENGKGGDGGLRHVSLKAGPAAVRMETPVIYFYANRDMNISTKVDFPKGKITEWYPQARGVGKGIDWGTIKVQPGAVINLPADYSDNHYYAARETDAALVQVCGTSGR